MIPLYRKELRALWPLFVLCALLNSGDVLYRPLLERLDQSSWTGISAYIRPGENWGAELVILAFVVAYAAFPREHDERTIEMLYALPVSRRSIFLAKVASGLTILFAALALVTCTDAVMSNLSGQSLTGGQWRLDLALQFTLLCWVLAFVAYAHGLLASVLRFFGTIPYIIGYLLVAGLDDLVPPLRWLDPTEIMRPRYEGTTLVFPWAPVLGHLVVALLVYCLAYVGWMGPGQVIARGFEKLRAGIAGKIAFGCAGLVLFGFVGLIALGLMIGGGDDEQESAASFATSTRTTEHFAFTYPSNLRARAEPLMGHADALHTEIARRLGEGPGPVLTADLSDTSPEHLGITSWTTVRVGLAAERDPVRLERTFVHETTHAFQQRLGRGAPFTRFFAEGSAEWMSYAIVPGDTLNGSRRVAAATWLRHRMRFEDLADDERLHARFDPLLVYPIGELWTQALVDTYGEAAIGAVWRAIGQRTSTPDDVREAFGSALRDAGMDLDRVQAHFEALVREIAERERDAIAAMPRIGGAPSAREGLSVRIQARLDRPAQEGWTPTLRLRASPNDDDTEMLGFNGEIDRSDRTRVTFDLPTPILPADRVQLLFGVQLDPQEWPMTETWQWVSLPR